MWRFAAPNAAERAEHTLLRLRRQGRAGVEDAAILSWPPGSCAPAVRHLHSLAGVRSLVDAFWSLQLGVAFFAPLLAPSSQAGGEVLSAVGIDGRFVEQLRRRVGAGSSALLVLSSDAGAEQIDAAFSELVPEAPIRTSLSETQTDRLHDVFGPQHA